jgi:hypothetical protein
MTHVPSRPIVPRAAAILSLCGALVLALAFAAPAPATTLIRAGLEDLVATHGTIVVGEVLEAHSYWNSNGNFILTDVRVLASEVLKGDAEDRLFTVTIPGGTVGELTTLILGGAELTPGSPYVLFLSEEDLPGAHRVRTVREHAQGVFEVRQTPAGPRAVSQAAGMPLVPDVTGQTAPPGGAEGLALETMIQSIRDLEGR